MTSVDDSVTAYLQSKAVGDPDGPGAGTYASNAESILRRFAAWLAEDQGITDLGDVEVEHIRAYARSLRVRTRRDEYTASTARTYFAVVRAFLSWCVRDRRIETNPAATDAAEEALPSDDGGSSRQFWSPEKRRELESFVRERALAAADEGGEEDRLARLREYAMVAVLAHTGVRGAELFRVPEDDRRTGATWADVDFYTGTIRVLGKSQRLEDAPLPGAARTPLRKYRVVLDPPSNDWPLFPTRHAPSIASRVKSELRERGHDEGEIEEILDGTTSAAVARDRAIAPPAITTEGARSILKRLCDEADVDLDGEYLKPHGARRGLGDELYRSDPTTAQSALRHTSIAVTKRSYSHIEAGEVSDAIDDLREED